MKSFYLTLSILATAISASKVGYFFVFDEGKLKPITGYSFSEKVHYLGLGTPDTVPSYTYDEGTVTSNTKAQEMLYEANNCYVMAPKNIGNLMKIELDEKSKVVSPDSFLCKSSLLKDHKILMIGNFQNKDTECSPVDIFFYSPEEALAKGA